MPFPPPEAPIEVQIELEGNHRRGGEESAHLRPPGLFEQAAGNAAEGNGAVSDGFVGRASEEEIQDHSELQLV